MSERVRTARCMCGQLSLECRGEPVRVSVCHCLDCQRRSGSAFAVQARYPAGMVEISGRTHFWTSIGPSGAETSFFLCPDCGSGGWFMNAGQPDLVAIPVGSFADPGFPVPIYSVYETRKHEWVSIVGTGIDHYD